MIPGAGYSIVTNWWRGWPAVSKIVSLSSGAFVGWLKCWAHLGLSICTSHGLSTMMTSLKLDFLHLVQNSKSKCASKQGRSHMAFYDLPSEVTLSHFNCALLLKAVESPLNLRETPNSKSWWEECQRMCSHALKLSQCKTNKILLATWKTREQPAVESLPHLV